MSCAPPLLSSNQFSVLEVIEPKMMKTHKSPIHPHSRQPNPTSRASRAIDGMAVSAVASHFSAVSAIISGWPAYSEAKYRTARTDFGSSWPFSCSATSMYLEIKQYTKPQVHILQHNKLQSIKYRMTINIIWVVFKCE